jgi:hypothetical protein
LQNWMAGSTYNQERMVVPEFDYGFQFQDKIL